MKANLKSLLAVLCTIFLVGTAAAQTITIDAVTTSFGRKVVTAEARFGHNIGPAANVTVEFHLSGNPACGGTTGVPANRIVQVALFEDNIRVAASLAFGCGAEATSLTYRPTVPGLKNLIIVGSTASSEIKSGGVPVEMYGVTLNTALGATVTTPYLPFTSRIFLQANALVVDANIKKAEFFHRSLPFQLTSGIKYAVGEKVLSDGRLFLVDTIATSDTLPLGSERSLVGESDQARDTIGDITFRYVGPRISSGIDFYNYREPVDPAVVIPQEYPAVPRGRADLVIGNAAGDVYEVLVAGRLVAAVDLNGSTQDADGVVAFECVGNPLVSGTYLRGDLVISNNRIYEVIQPGSTGQDLGSGLTHTTGEVQTIGSATFNFIPSKVFRDLLPYWEGDLLISSGRVYRVTIGGTLKQGQATAPLSAIKNGPAEQRSSFVRFQRVGSAFSPSASYSDGDVLSSNNRIYKVVSSNPPPAAAMTATAPSASLQQDPYQQQDFPEDPNFAFQLVIPQFQRYTQLASDYAGIPLQEGVVYRVGDAVVSNGGIYEVEIGGTMGPVGNGLSLQGRETLGGLTFNYLSPAFKQLSTVRPFADVPFPYSAFDYSFPYTLRWSPAESIANHFSLFGRFGYFENHTDLELFTRTTDSKDRTNVSSTVPMTILPPINPRATLVATITAPAPERLVAAGESVQITAEVKDENGTVRVVRAVQFYVDGVALAAPDLTFPYTTEGPQHWIPTIAGTYILNALAVDDKGNFTISPDLRVNVTDNQPFVRLTGPGSADASHPFAVASGTTVQITGVATGSGGAPARVKSVDVFSDGNLIGSTTAAGDGTFAVSFPVANAAGAALTYQLTARVTDLNGATANSNVMYIQVSPPASSGGGSNPVTITTIEFAQITYAAATSDSGVSIAVNAVRAAGDNGPISVNYTTADGSALAGQDYQPQSGTLVFGPGETQKIINVILFPKSGLGPDRAFLLLLSSPSKGQLGSKSTATVVISSPDLSTKVRNVSTRGPVEQGSEVMIAGFIIQGGGSKRIIIRGLGPSLSQFGVVNPLTDPNLTLVDANGNQIAFDEDYGTNSQANLSILNTNGLTPSDTREAAIVATLSPGAYTAILRGKTNGIGLVETYDIDATGASSLMNISTRGKVEQGDNGAMIAGFIISPPTGQSGSAVRVAVRAIGPSLKLAGVTTALSDTTLDLYRGSQLILSNDNWKTNSTSDQQELKADGLTPTSDKEAVLITNLDPGSYSAVVRGKGDTTGVALVEVYRISP